VNGLSFSGARRFSSSSHRRDGEIFHALSLLLCLLKGGAFDSNRVCDPLSETAKKSRDISVQRCRSFGAAVAVTCRKKRKKSAIEMSFTGSRDIASFEIDLQ